jgi:hypothetical protein
MKTVIVSAFPACGKSYVYENQLRYDLTCLDSDSSEFSWIKDSQGVNTSERNPEFPNNYIQHIKDNIGEVDIIFVSSHDVVVDALEDNKLAYVKVVPSKECLAEWIGRYWLRGDDDKFICFIRDNWIKFTDPKNDLTKESMVGKVILKHNEFVTDHVHWLKTLIGNYK